MFIECVYILWVHVYIVSICCEYILWVFIVRICCEYMLCVYVGVGYFLVLLYDVVIYVKFLRRSVPWLTINSQIFSGLS